MENKITEQELINKYCALIRHYIEERHYRLDREECSDFGSYYFVIKRYDGDDSWTKIRVSNHSPIDKHDDIDVHFRIDMRSLKRPTKKLKEKVYRVLDSAMNKTAYLHCRSCIKHLV